MNFDKVKNYYRREMIKPKIIIMTDERNRVPLY